MYVLKKSSLYSSNVFFLINDRKKFTKEERFNWIYEYQKLLGPCFYSSDSSLAFVVPEKRKEKKFLSLIKKTSKNLPGNSAKI